MNGCSPFILPSFCARKSVINTTTDAQSLTTFQVHTQRRFNVHAASSQRYGRCMNVEITLCAYRARVQDLFKSQILI